MIDLRILVAAGVLTLTCAQVASAQPNAPSPASAEQEFARAIELYEQRRFSDALPKFEATLVATGSPNAGLYAARCLRELGRWVEAYGVMQKAMNTAKDRAVEDPRYEKTRESAEKELAPIAAQIGFVRLSGTSTGDRVTVAGVEVSGPTRGDPIAVEPDKPVAIVIARGDRTETKTVTVATGSTVDVDLSAAASSRAPGPEPVVPPPPPKESAGPHPLTIAGATLTAVGGASLVTGAVLGALALVRKSDGESFCNGEVCTQAGLDLHDESLSFANGSNVTLSVGAAAAIAGVVMLIVAPSEQQVATEERMGFVVAPAPSGFMAEWRMSWH